MQHGKSLLEVLKEGLVGRVNRRARCGHVPLVIKAKAAVFATILIPCFLQFPLPALGQERPDGIDSGLVLKKGAGECINGKRVVADSGDSARKGGFVVVNSGSDGVPSVMQRSEPMTSQKDGQRSGNTKKPPVGGAENEAEDLHVLLSLIPMYLVALWFWPWPWRRSATYNVGIHRLPKAVRCNDRLDLTLAP